MSKEETTIEPFDVTEESLSAILDVKAESDTPQEESSAPLESVEVAPDTDAETETEEEISEVAETVEEDKTEEEKTEEEKSESLVSDKELLVEKDGKTYDFTTAPKEMREVVKAQNRLVNAFVRDNIDAVQTELKNLSPSSYAKLEQRIVQTGADAYPDKWAEYLVQTNPQMVTDVLLTSLAAENEDLKNADPKLLAELYRVYTEQSEEGEDLRTILELRDPNFGKKVDTLPSPDQQELAERRRKEKEEAAKNESAEVARVYEEVYDIIERETVAPIVQQFGLMPDPNDSPQTAAAKRRIINGLTPIIDDELSSDPDTKDDYAAFIKKLNNKDKAGALAISPFLNHKIGSIVLEHLGYIKNQQTASLVKKHTPAKKPPTALAAAGSIVPPVDKPLTLSQRLETQSDEEYLRNMGVA